MALEEEIILRGDQEVLRILARIGKSGSETFERIAKAADQAAANVENIVDRLNRAADTMQRVGRSMSLYVTAPIVAVGALGVRSFANFEQGMVGVSKTTNIVGADLEKLGKEIRSIAREVPVATGELLEIAQAAGQLGVSAPQDILAFTETVGKLGIATNLAGEEAASTIARILTVTGTALGEVDRFGSSLVALGNNFAATEAEIARAATRVAQATAQFGVSAANVAGIGAALRSLGIEAEAGGTQVGLAFQAINDAVRNGGQEAEALAHITGRSVGEMADLFRTDATAAFQIFVEGLGRIRDEGGDVAAALETMGLSGIRSVQVLGTLATRADVLGKTLEMSNKAYKENTALADEAAAASQSFFARWQIFMNRVDEAASAIGEVLVPVLNVMISILGSLTDAFTALPFWIRAVIVGILGLVAAIGPVLIALASFTRLLAFAFPFLASVNGITGLLTLAFGKLRVGLVAIVGIVRGLTLALPLLRAAFLALSAATGGLPILLAAVGAAIGYLIVFLAQNSDQWGEWYEAAQAAVVSVLEALSAFVEQAIAYAQAIIAWYNGINVALEQAVADVIASMLAQWQGFRDGVIAAFSQIRDYVLRVYNEIKNALSEIFGEGGGSFAGAQARSRGGSIYGPGTGTSDSIPIWASAGEFMIKASAVRKYGLGFMHAINNMRFDPDAMFGYAMGGLVTMPAAISPRASFAGGGPVSTSRNVLDLTISGETFPGLIVEDESTMQRLTKFATRQQIKSSGRKPSWKR